MKSFKVAALMVVAFLAISVLSGCTVTGQSSVAKSSPVVSEGVVQGNPLYRAIKNGEASGYPGTSNFLLSFNLEPNLDNNSAREVMSNTLDSANMLAGKGGSAKYVIRSELVDKGGYGHMTLKTSATNMDRSLVIRYIMRDIDTSKVVFDKTILGEGTADGENSSLFHSFAYLLKDRIASEIAYADAFSKLVENLKEFSLAIENGGRVDSVSDTESLRE